MLSALARCWPWPVDGDEGVARALGFLGADVDAETVGRASNAAGVAGGVVTLVAAALCDIALPLAVLLGTGTGAAVTFAVRRHPVVRADLRRTRAIGAATGLFGRVVLRMRVEPTVERAATFAARTGTGPLAESLDDHCRRARGTPDAGLTAFATEWAAWFPALTRAADLVESAAAAPADDRPAALERALSTVLDGTRDRVADFAAEIRPPATGLYAFGVLLPLALVGLLPAARVAGLHVSAAEFVVLYDLVLPATLAGASVHLLRRRPVAFPPPRVDRTHPDVPDRRVLAPATGLVAALGAWVVVRRIVAPWAAPLGAAGIGAGTALVVGYRPVDAVRDRVRAVERGLDDALYLIGRRVAAGESVESALQTASEEVSGATGDVLSDAVGVGRRLGADVRESFLGAHGALADLPSPRARGVAALVGLAAVEGRQTGDALVATAEHLRALRRLERDAKRELSQVTATLSNTAAVFAPLVSGATVSLAAGMNRPATAPRAVSSGLSFGSGALPVTAVGPAVGTYALLLAVLLTALSTALESGIDRSLLAYRAGLALLSATTTFLAAVVAGRLLL